MSWLDSLAAIRERDWSEAPEDLRESTAKDVISMSAYASAGAAVVPVPLVDLALLVPVHSAMVMTLGHVYGRPITDTEAKRVVLELGAVAGATLAGRAAVSALKKLLLPGIGGVLVAPASFAVTWGFGWLAIAYFKDPHLSRDELREVFRDAMRDAGGVFSKERLERFRTGGGDGPDESAEAATDSEEESPASEDSPGSASSPPVSEPADAVPRKKRTI